MEINSEVLEINSELLEKVNQSGLVENIHACMQCGMCVASCTAARVTPFHIRKIIEQVLQGDHKVLESDALWDCLLCDTCFVQCPRNIQPSLLIMVLRTLALQEGYGWDRLEKLHWYVRNFYETGIGLPLHAPDIGAPIDLLAKRDMEHIFQEMGVHKREVSEKGRAELQTLLELTGFTEKLVSLEPHDMDARNWERA